MNRLWFGIILLVLLLVVGIWVGYFMNSTGGEIRVLLDSAAETALTGDLQTATALATDAQEQWEAAWHRIAAMADHAPMDEIDGLFSQLTIYANTDAAADFAAYCGRISQLIHAVGEAHSLNWWNLL